MTAAGGEIRTTCPYCGVGCGVVARHRDDRLLAVAGDPDHPANRGRLCVKGSTLPETQHGGGRLLHPELHGRRMSWDAALDRIAAELSKTIADHGPGAVALYLSGQLLTEDYFVANKLMKGFLGSANVDTNSRLCMASAVAAHKRAFGEDVVPCDYRDLETCELLVLVGSNAAWAHPVLFQRIRARRDRGELRVVVIDPRRTATCDIADLHLPLSPGSDAMLFNALLAHLSRHHAIDDAYVQAHTEGLEAALSAARADADAVAEATGLPLHDIHTFFQWFTGTSATVTLFSQGVNQAANGTDKANAIINCHLATGRIGRPGMGPFSITGQPNAMGGREVGGMANQLAAHADFDDAEVQRLSRFWGSTNVARAQGRKAVDMFDAIGRGDIRFVWIMGTNPVVSLPASDAVRAALQRCPFVVVSDCVAQTDTTACADLLLPAAGWGEKDGTVTNSERRISRQRAFLQAPGESRPDWWAICRVAERLGFGSAFDYGGPADIFAEHAALSGVINRGRRLFDIGALADLSRAEYDALKPVQWPLSAHGDDAPRPFEGGSFPTPSGRARFVAVRHRPPIQQPDTLHPFILNSGRLRDQWHTMTRTGTAPRLFGHSDTPAVQVNAADAARLSLQAGDLVELANGSGSVRAVTEVSEDVSPGELFLPMHWNARFASRARVNSLMAGAVDPVSGQPESKHAAVSLEPCTVARWIRLASVRRLPRTLLCEAHYWTRLPVEGGWRYELAMAEDAAAARWLERLKEWVAADNTIEYQDPASGEHRLLAEHQEALLLAAFAGPQRRALPPASYVYGLLESRPDVPPWRLLAGPGAADADGSRLICTCFGVREAAIRAAVSAGATSVDQLGARLSCGTNCGSCVPELRALIAGSPP